ncbi:hypothetical protein CLOM_g2423 [Closterium sp. NIES-68]|nr:hypothetical protein CLOM_g2423 [Closterium sp. NIES-68]
MGASSRLDIPEATAGTDGASKAQLPSDAEQQKRGGRVTWGRVVCCSLCALLLLLAVAVAVAVSIFVLYQPMAPEFTVTRITIAHMALTPLLPPTPPSSLPLLPATAPASLPPPNVPLPGNTSLPGNLSLPSLTAPLPSNFTLTTAQLAAAVNATAAAATLPANSTSPPSPAATAAAAAASRLISPLASSPLLTSPLLANANLTINAPPGTTLVGLLAAREAELDGALDVAVVAGNRNHVGISYEYVSILARFQDKDVGNASIPAFHQPPRSNTTVQARVLLTHLPLHLSPAVNSPLSRQALSANSTLPLQLAIEVRANVDVYNIGTPYITVNLMCDLDVNIAQQSVNNTRCHLEGIHL